MSYSWVQKLNENNNVKYKEQVLKQAREAATLGARNAILFCKFIQFCYNPLTQFYILNYPNTENITKAENAWEEFYSILEALSDSTLLGTDIDKKLNEISQKFTSIEWNNFCIPILKKQLLTGIDFKLYNKVFSETEYRISNIKVNPIKKITSIDDLTGNKIIMPIFKGKRILLALIPKSRGLFVYSYDQYGQEVKISANLEHQLAECFSKVVNLSKGADFARDLLKGFIFDAYLQNNDVVVVTDLISVEKLSDGAYNVPLHKRINLLEKNRRLLQSYPCFIIPPYLGVDLNTQKGKEHLIEWANEIINKGYDGIVIKDVLSYYNGEESIWYKFTLQIPAIMTVKDFVSKNDDIKKIILSDTEEKFTDIVITNFKTYQKDILLKNLNNLKGKKVEITGKSINFTKNKKLKLTNPKFVKII